MIDGIDIREYNLYSLRDHISLVAQVLHILVLIFSFFSSFMISFFFTIIFSSFSFPLFALGTIQEPVLFSGSIADNISYGCQNASMEVCSFVSNECSFLSACSPCMVFPLFLLQSSVAWYFLLRSKFSIIFCRRFFFRRKLSKLLSKPTHIISYPNFLKDTRLKSEKRVFSLVVDNVSESRLVEPY